MTDASVPVRLMCAADRAYFRHIAVMLTSVVWNLGRRLLPRSYVALWDSNRVRARLPRVLSVELKIFAWQLRMLAKRALGRT